MADPKAHEIKSPDKAPEPDSKVLTQKDQDDLLAFRGQQEQAAKEAAKIAPPPPSHYLNLENGQVVESAGVMTNWHGLVVLNSVPITQTIPSPAPSERVNQ